MALVSEAEARALFGGSAERLETIVKRFTTERTVPIKILGPLAATQGHAFEGELAHWIEVFERFEMEVADPAYAELRAPGTKVGLSDYLDKRGPSWLADLIGYLSAASVIVQQDEMSFLASWASTPGGSARVYYFHPNDWGLWPTDESIAARLFRLLEEEEREEFSHYRFENSERRRLGSALKLFEAVASAEPLPPHLDPAKLFLRTEWLVHALLGVGRDLTSATARAAPLSVWEAEKVLASRWPHIATYWLWSHWFLDNRMELNEAMTITEQLVSPVVVESRKTIDKLLSTKKAVKLAGRDRKALGETKAQIARAAPNDVLDAGARQRLHERLADEEKDSRAAHLAVAELERAAADEPLVKEALRLLEHLARGGAIPPSTAPVQGGLEVDAAMDRLAESVDQRFRPLVLARLERACRVGDTHEGAGWGLILSWAALARDFAEFKSELDGFGMEQFGPRRMTELYRAYGRFAEPEATRILAEGARRWLDEMDDWIRMAPDEPLIQLMKRDTLETHEVLAKLLEKANYSPANWDMCVRAAVAVGELKSKRGQKGLERAVSRRLGRIDDGSRASVVRALHQLNGDASAPFLETALDELIARWEGATDDEDAFEHQKDAACVLTGLLPMKPDDKKILKIAKTLLGLFEIQLGPKRRPRRDVIAATSAIIWGVQTGEVRALREAVAPFTRVEFAETPATRYAAKELRELASLVYTELAA